MGGFQSIQAARPGAGEAPLAPSRRVRAWLRAGLLLGLVAAGPADSASPGAGPGVEERPLVVTAVARIDRPSLRAEGRRAARAADAPAPLPGARVSTSPEASGPSPFAIEPPTPRTSDDDGLPPLTRAATRRRVESISPVPWLARFGPVSLERHE
ncbi:MAG: hypothetical protein R3F21_24375 [Myxococcota bacterium]